MAYDPFLAFLVDPAKATVWSTGYLLDGWTMTRKGDRWLLVIKVTGKKGNPLVAFINSNSAEGCMRYWHGALCSDSYALKWHPDQFRKV